jgi:general secretion pathway protein G
MKMFFAVFFAILAAVAVIFAVLLAKPMIDAGVQRAIAKTKRKSMRVQFDIRLIKTQLHLYKSLSGFLPTTDQGLQALVTQPQNDPRLTRWYQLFKELPKDPWGSDYIYRSPGRKNPEGYDLYSAGPDRQADTGDDDWGGP